MKFEYKEVTVREVLRRIADTGAGVELYVRDKKDEPWSHRPKLVTGANLYKHAEYRFIVSYNNYAYAAEQVLDFGECPSPHGWHNPGESTAEQVLRFARVRWGEDVDPSTVRLLTRDEIGFRVDSSRITTSGGHSSQRKYVGDKVPLTYITLVPYGQLPVQESYTFPECAPYGWSRTTGLKIPVLKSYKLLPPDFREQGIRSLDGIHCYYKDGEREYYGLMTVADLFADLTPEILRQEYVAIFYRPLPETDTLDVEVKISRGADIQHHGRVALEAGQELRVRVRNDNKQLLWKKHLKN